jgi:hypothetical protein
MVAPITFPHVGGRVWTIPGLQNHGPLEGPKVSVPANTGGTITGIEKPHYAPTIGEDLYVIEWDTEQKTKHYFSGFGDVLCIGPFETLADFELALRTASTGELTRGPQGGFREFRATLHAPVGELLVVAVKEQNRIWQYLEPLVQKAGIQLTETRIKPAAKTRQGITKTDHSV